MEQEPEASESRAGKSSQGAGEDTLQLGDQTEKSSNSGGGVEIHPGPSALDITCHWGRGRTTEIQLLPKTEAEPEQWKMPCPQPGL